MNYADLIEAFGSGSKAARELGFNRQTVHRWKAAGIPEHVQLEIHRKTSGKVKADAPILAKYREILHGA